MSNHNNDKIELCFNGDSIWVEPNLSLQHFLSHNEVLGGRFIVVVNDQLIPKAHYQLTTLASGDAVDIISPITGG